MHLTHWCWTDTDEELKEWKTKFEERIALLESKISKLEREMNDSETKSSFLKQTISESIWEISRLQTEAEVMTLTSLCYFRDNYLVWNLNVIIVESFKFDFRLICPWRMNEILPFKIFLQRTI